MIIIASGHSGVTKGEGEADEDSCPWAQQARGAK